MWGGGKARRSSAVRKEKWSRLVICPQEGRKKKRGGHTVKQPGKRGKATSLIRSHAGHPQVPVLRSGEGTQKQKKTKKTPFMVAGGRWKVWSAIRKGEKRRDGLVHRKGWRRTGGIHLEIPNSFGIGKKIRSWRRDEQNTHAKTPKKNRITPVYTKGRRNLANKGGDDHPYAGRQKRKMISDE